MSESRPELLDPESHHLDLVYKSLEFITQELLRFLTFSLLSHLTRTKSFNFSDPRLLHP